MKTLNAILFILVSLCWTSAQAEYDPDSYGYINLSFGPNQGDDWIDADELGTGLSLGAVKRLSEWDIFGGLRWEHTSQLMAGVPVNDDEENWLDHVGGTLEYRYSGGEYNPDSYFYARVFAGMDRLEDEVKGGEDGSVTIDFGTGYGVGYTHRLTDWDLFGSLRYKSHHDGLFGDVFLEHYGAVAEWRF